MDTIPKIKLYGADGCHKTHYYQLVLDKTGLTITIGKKKLRNPYKEDIEKWLNKLIPSRLDIVHDKENMRFTLDINGELAKVDYSINNDKMYLNHSEVPYNLRGQGIGKVLVEKTFEQLTKEGYKAVAVCTYIKAVARRSDKWSKIIQ